MDGRAWRRCRGQRGDPEPPNGSPRVDCKAVIGCFDFTPFDPFEVSLESCSSSSHHLTAGKQGGDATSFGKLLQAVLCDTTNLSVLPQHV